MHVRKAILSVFFILIYSACTEDYPEPERLFELRPLSLQEQTLLNSSNEFSFELLRMLHHENFNRNLLFSTIGIGNGIGMSFNVLEDKPKKELKHFLRVDGVPDNDINRAYYQLSELLNKIDENIRFTIVNSLWINNEYAISDLTGDKLMAYYDAEVSFLNFRNSNSVRTINKWIEVSTNGKVTGIIDNINPGDRSYILNAIHLESSVFLHSKPLSLPEYQFSLYNGRKLTYDKLNLLKGRFNYGLAADHEIIDIPAGHEHFHLTLIIPRNRVSMERLINTLNPELFLNFLGQAEPASGKLIMPEFQIDSEISLKGLFPEFGLTGPLTAMNNYFDSREVIISDFIHKSVWSAGHREEDELNITEVEDVYSGMGDYLIIDHPFLFVFREKNTGGIIFIGLVLNPITK